MDDKKRFFWLKLKEDFFQDEAIEWLEEQENGKEYVLFYLKLCLKSLKNNGLLIRQVGNVLMPYDVSKLADITRTHIDTVAVALKTLCEIGLVEIQEGGELYLTQLQAMVGSESATPAAIKKRAYRERIKGRKEDRVGTNCPTEYRDKSIELRVKKKEKDISNDISKKKTQKHQYGSYNNVLLSDEELTKLKAEFVDWENRIERLSEYIASSGKSYKSHLATIRMWAKKDQEKGGEVVGNGKQYPRGNAPKAESEYAFIKTERV